MDALCYSNHQVSQTQWRASLDPIAKLLYLFLWTRAEHLGENDHEYVRAAFFMFTLFKDKAEKLRGSRGFCRVIGQLKLFTFPQFQGLSSRRCGIWCQARA